MWKYVYLGKIYIDIQFFFTQGASRQAFLKSGSHFIMMTQWANFCIDHAKCNIDLLRILWNSEWIWFVYVYILLIGGSFPPYDILQHRVPALLAIY